MLAICLKHIDAQVSNSLVSVSILMFLSRVFFYILDSATMVSPSLRWTPSSSTLPKITAPSQISSSTGTLSTRRSSKQAIQSQLPPILSMSCAQPLRKNLMRKSLHLPGLFQRAKNSKLSSLELQA